MKSFLPREDPHPPEPQTPAEAWKLLEELRDGKHEGMPMYRIERAWTLALLDLREKLSRSSW